MTYCSIENCLDRDKHNIHYHYCVKCKQRGHGKTKHQSFLSKCLSKLLLKKKNRNRICPVVRIPVDKYCKKYYCQNKATHTTEGHRCSFCDGMHTEFDCKNIVDKMVSCPFCRQPTNIDKICTEIYKDNEECMICMNNKLKTANIGCCQIIHLCHRCLVQIILTRKI